MAFNSSKVRSVDFCFAWCLGEQNICLRQVRCRGSFPQESLSTEREPPLWLSGPTQADEWRFEGCSRKLGRQEKNSLHSWIARSSCCFQKWGAHGVTFSFLVDSLSLICNVWLNYLSISEKTSLI